MHMKLNPQCFVHLLQICLTLNVFALVSVLACRLVVILVQCDSALCVCRFCMQFSEVPNMSEPNQELLSMAVSLLNQLMYIHIYIYIYIYIYLYIAVTSLVQQTYINILISSQVFLRYCATQICFTPISLHHQTNSLVLDNACITPVNGVLCREYHI